jgi:hypothetical protein
MCKSLVWLRLGTQLIHSFSNNRVVTVCRYGSCELMLGCIAKAMNYEIMINAGEVRWRLLAWCVCCHVMPCTAQLLHVCVCGAWSLNPAANCSTGFEDMRWYDCS